MNKHVGNLLIPVIAIILIFAGYGTLYAQTPSTLASSRHTVGFPSSIGIDELEKLLQELNISSIKNISRYKEVLENISRGYPEASNLSKALEFYTNMKEGNINSIDDIYNSIDSNTLRYLLRDVVSRYKNNEHVNRTEIENLLNRIQNLYSSHEISSTDLLKALSILKMISGSEGYGDLASNIDSRTSSIAMEIGNKLLNILKNVGGYPEAPGSEVQQGPQVPRADILSKISIPSISPAFPHIQQVNTGIYPLALFGIAIAIGVIAYRRLGRGIAYRIRRNFAKRNIGFTNTGFSKVIESYWRAVRIVEIRIGKHRFDWQTHREYEREVREGLGNLGEVFSELTKIYELVRYGGEHESKYLGKVDDIMKKLGGMA